jgi:hypothetical protein
MPSRKNRNPSRTKWIHPSRATRATEIALDGSSAAHQPPDLPRRSNHRGRCGACRNVAGLVPEQNADTDPASRLPRQGSRCAGERRRRLRGHPRTGSPVERSGHIRAPDPGARKQAIARRETLAGSLVKGTSGAVERTPFREDVPETTLRQSACKRGASGRSVRFGGAVYRNGNLVGSPNLTMYRSATGGVRVHQVGVNPSERAVVSAGCCVTRNP